jgi:two-component system sensor histidine kinase AgrC
MTQIEELYQQLRGFKHDYANIMASMASYIEYEDLVGLREYYHREILPISAKMNKCNDEVTKLHNLDIVELKSLIALKLNYALERNIEISLEVAEKINWLEMKILDLVRVVGILMDNAIEACQECEKASMQIAIIRMERNVTFIISNTYSKCDIDYLKLGTEGISSKGKQRGIGLYNIKSILNEYDNVFLDTEFDENIFTQTLQICATEENGEDLVI